jgi:hypothetical protein
VKALKTLERNACCRCAEHPGSGLAAQGMSLPAAVKSLPALTATKRSIGRGLQVTLRAARSCAVCGRTYCLRGRRAKMTFDSSSA